MCACGGKGASGSSMLSSGGPRFVVTTRTGAQITYGNEQDALRHTRKDPSATYQKISGRGNRRSGRTGRTGGSTINAPSVTRKSSLSSSLSRKQPIPIKKPNRLKRRSA